MLKNVRSKDILVVFYCIIVVPPLGDVIDVLGHVKVLERINVNLNL